MADIFISYAKADRNLAQQLAAHLEAQGRTTWWDTDVGAGQSPRSTIDQELESAHKVIVLWSKASIGSPFVLHEAITARDAGKLVQVKTSDIEVSDIPRPLRALSPVNASDLVSIASAVDEHARDANDLPIDTVLQKARLRGRRWPWYAGDLAFPSNRGDAPDQGCSVFSAMPGFGHAGLGGGSDGLVRRAGWHLDSCTTGC
jgi:hypothetical protein